ncbi:MAG: ribulose-phosphate 3-epimerase [Bacillota bacterium]|nr:ribulose-phosphate 3-epimerase [Bacillota bacterium]
MTRPFPWVAPSILSADFARLGEEVAAVGEADLLHVDVMDGHFVPNLTVGPGVVGALHRVTPLPLDVHLMISEPDRYLEEFAAAGAAFLTVHVEACPHLHRTLEHIRALGVKAGVALNPATPLETIRYVWEAADLVLVMTVNPGFGGQRLVEAVLPKIRRARRLSGRLRQPPLIEVDGGVTAANASRLVEAGAQILVAGSAVFGAADRRAALAALRAGGSRPGGSRT